MASRLKLLKSARERQAALSRVTAPWPEAAGFARLWRRRHWLLFCLDTIMCMSSFIGIYYLRFHVDFFSFPFAREFPIAPALSPYLKASALATSLWIFLLYRERSYRDDLHFVTAFTYRMRMVLVTGFYTMVFLMVISFMFRSLLLSRIVYVIGFACACSLMILVRVGFRAVERRLSHACVSVYRILVIGWSKNVETLLRRLQERNQCTHVLGRLAWSRRNDRGEANGSAVPLLGMVEDLETIYGQAPFDQLLLVVDGLGEDGTVKYEDKIIHVLNFSEEQGICFYMVPKLFDVMVTRTELGSFSGIPLIRLQDAAIHPVYGSVKRFVDIVVSAAVLALGLPIWLLIALVIKLTSGGPVIYVQERAGLHGKPFRMYKFRSMVSDADERLRQMISFDKLKEPVFKFNNDPRVTPVGKVLRRLGLDEIPQMVNILMGEMSLVGPRPEQVELVARYDARQRRRLKARPGITGYQQVMCRGDISLEKRIEYDLYYLKHQSPLLDTFIIAKTLLVVLRGDGIK